MHVAIEIISISQNIRSLDVTRKCMTLRVTFYYILEMFVHAKSLRSCPTMCSVTLHPCALPSFTSYETFSGHLSSSQVSLN